MLIHGVHIDLVNWREAVPKLRWQDIARNLGRIVRFAGATEIPVSVLTHSFACQRVAEHLHGNSRIQKLCLVHDCCEAIISDIPRPFKSQDMKALENQMLFAFWEKACVAPPEGHEQDLISKIDNWVLAAEVEVYNLLGHEQFWGPANPAIRGIVYWTGQQYPFILTCGESREINSSWQDFERKIQELC